ncbi:MAG: phosphatase PAP2 family protein [Gammaproteobacteria bacterium]
MLDPSGRAAPWQPDQRFWLTHFWLPLAAAAVLITLAEYTNVDLWLADRWYAFEGYRWSLRDHWLTYDVIHHHAKHVLIGFGLLVLGLFLAGFRSERLARWRYPLGYLVASFILLPSVIARSKQFSPVPCPWDLQRYGGDVPWQEHYALAAGLVSEAGHCFPSGHASGGFALLAIYFAALPFARVPALFLLPGIVVGTVFALGQQARGAHFLSHDIWTVFLCWFGALALFLLFRPRRWSAGYGVT